MSGARDGPDPEERLRRPTPDMTLSFGRLWILFAVVMAIGAGMLLQSERLWQTVGLFLLLSPVIAFSLLMLAYYVKERLAAR